MFEAKKRKVGQGHDENGDGILDEHQGAAGGEEEDSRALLCFSTQVRVPRRSLNSCVGRLSLTVLFSTLAAFLCRSPFVDVLFSTTGLRLQQ